MESVLNSLCNNDPSPTDHHMLTGTLNFYVKIYVSSTNHRPKLGIEGKTKWCLEVKEMNAYNVVYPTCEAPVAQWTSVLDF